jgi:transposase
MIGSTRHSYTFANKNKQDRLFAFLEEYNRVCLVSIDYIWDNLNEKLELLKFLDYKIIPTETDLGRRAFQCAVNQAGAIIRAVIEKQRRRNWVKENKNKNVKDVKFSKPKLAFVAPQLNSNCVDFEIDEEGHFEGFVRIRYVGSAYGQILLPINKSSQYNKWKTERRANLYGSLILFKDRFQLSWDWERSPHEQGEKIIGIDQGMKDLCTLSDGQTTPKICPHGHSYESIVNKLSRKNKGSKSFKKACTHRKNFVNYSVNQLNFKDVKEVRLEKVVNIRSGTKTSRSMSHWSNPEIRDKIKRRCEELEVPVVEQSCAYRSQRCSNCGLVRKANRKKKVYSCRGCKNEMDADLNAALNHEQDLTPVPFAFLGRKLNLGDGFYWKQEGFFKVDGSELIVQSSQERNI